MNSFPLARSKCVAIQTSTLGFIAEDAETKERGKLEDCGGGHGISVNRARNLSFQEKSHFPHKHRYITQKNIIGKIQHSENEKIFDTKVNTYVVFRSNDNLYHWKSKDINMILVTTTNYLCSKLFYDQKLA